MKYVEINDKEARMIVGGSVFPILTGTGGLLAVEGPIEVFPILTGTGGLLAVEGPFGVCL